MPRLRLRHIHHIIHAACEISELSVPGVVEDAKDLISFELTLLLELVQDLDLTALTLPASFRIVRLDHVTGDEILGRGAITILALPSDSSGQPADPDDSPNPTVQATQGLITSMLDSGREKLMEAVKGFKAPIRIGTACSGTDIVVCHHWSFLPAPLT